MMTKKADYIKVNTDGLAKVIASRNENLESIVEVSHECIM